MRNSNDASRSSNRAVSEVLGYTFIFGFIVGSIAILTVSGFGVIGDIQNNEQLSNAERGFDVLQDNMDEVYAGGAPSRSTEISLGDSQIFFGDKTIMSVTVSGNPPISREITPVIFRVQGDRQLVYEAGAVLRENRDGGLVLNEPPITMIKGSGADSGQVLIPIVQTTAPAVQSMGGGSILVRGELANRQVLVKDLKADESIDSISIESSRNDIWVDYFSQKDYCNDADVIGGAATCEIDAEFQPRQLFVTEQTVRVELIN